MGGKCVNSMYLPLQVWDNTNHANWSLSTKHECLRGLSDLSFGYVF